MPWWTLLRYFGFISNIWNINFSIQFVLRKSITFCSNKVRNLLFAFTIFIAYAIRAIMNKFLAVIYSRIHEIFKFAEVNWATCYERILKCKSGIPICKWEKIYKLKCCIVSLIPSFAPREPCLCNCPFR